MKVDEHSMMENMKSETPRDTKSKRFGCRAVNQAAGEAGEFKEDSPEADAFTAILPKHFLSGWHSESESMNQTTRVLEGDSSGSRCNQRRLENRHSLDRDVHDDTHETDKEISVVLTARTQDQGTQLRKYPTIPRPVTTKFPCEGLRESQNKSLESLDCCLASQGITIANLVDFNRSRTSVSRRLSVGKTRFPTNPNHDASAKNILEMAQESCSCRQPTTLPKPTNIASAKPTRWQNPPNRWSFACSSGLPVLAAILLLVPSTFTVAQQVLHTPKPTPSNTTTQAAEYGSSRTGLHGLPLLHSDAGTLNSALDTTNNLEQNEKDVFEQRNSGDSRDWSAKRDSKRDSKTDVANKIEKKKQTDVFYHDPVAALPEEEIYLPPEIYDTDFWNNSNDSFYLQGDDNVENRDQGSLNYNAVTTEDPFFRFFQTEMIAENHVNFDQKNSTRRDDSDGTSKNDTVASEKPLDYSYDNNYSNRDDVSNILYYNSIVDSNGGTPNYVKGKDNETYDEQLDDSSGDVLPRATKSRKTRKEITKRKKSFSKQINTALAREMDRFEHDLKPENNVYDLGEKSDFQSSSKDSAMNAADSHGLENDISSNEAPGDYDDYLKVVVGPQDYASDEPHVKPSKLEDENYHQSPSAGLWGHEVLSSPQWSHYPKIYRGMKRDKLARKTMNLNHNKGGARILASSHYELQYILGRKIIFLCVARGRPRPRITWYKDGVELYAHNYFQVHEWDIGRFKLKSKMEIDPATPMDAGYYKCEANNEQGVDQAGFRTKYRVQ